MTCPVAANSDIRRVRLGCNVRIGAELIFHGTPRVSTRPRQAAMKCVTIVLLAIVLYPLSYAPTLRIVRDFNLVSVSNPFGVHDGGELPVYQPADWIIDRTPMRKPMLVWADLFGVRSDFEYAATNRESARESARGDGEWVDLH